MSRTLRRLRVAAIGTGAFLWAAGDSGAGRVILTFSAAATVDLALIRAFLRWRRGAHFASEFADALLPKAIRTALRHEAQTVALCARALTFRPLAPGSVANAIPCSFAADPKPGQFALALGILSVIELPLVHLFLSAIAAPLWVHGALAYLTLYGLVFLIADHRGLGENQNHWVSEFELKIRLGSRISADIPRSAITSARRLDPSSARSTHALRVSGGAAPNVVIELDEAVAVTVLFLERRYRIFHVYVDQPDRLVAALTL